MKLKIFGLGVFIQRPKTLTSTSGIEGYYDPVAKVIAIDAQFKGDEFHQVLLHELVHCVLFRTGVVQSKIPMEIQEVICENVATAITENFTMKVKKHGR